MATPFFVRRLLARAGGRYLPEPRPSAHPGVLRRASDRLLAAPVAAFADPLAGPSNDPAVLDLNPAFPVSESPVTGVRVAADRSGPPHPLGLPALREAVAESAGGPDPDGGVLVTPGATGAFHAVLDAFVNPGRPVVLLAPCSPLFATAAAARRARVRWVPTRVEGDRLRLDFDALSRAVRGAALVAIADPGNPLGFRLADEDADRLRWAAERSDVLLYVDETFRRFRGDAPGRRLGDLAPARTLAAGSLSAGDSLGSVRVGWLTGPPPLVQACGLVQATTTPFVPTVCQEVAWRTLMADRSDGRAEAITARRQDTAERLSELGLPASDPTDGYFLWADVSRHAASGRAFAENLLAVEGVRVGPGDRYGPGGERFVRLSAAADDGRLREGLARLARFVGHQPARPVPAERPAVARTPAFSRG